MSERGKAEEEILAMFEKLEGGPYTVMELAYKSKTGYQTFLTHFRAMVKKCTLPAQIRYEKINNGWAFYGKPGQKQMG